MKNTERSQERRGKKHGKNRRPSARRRRPDERPRAERQRMEEALRKSEKQYRLLIERQKEGLTIVDLEEQFVFCNPAGEEIFGVPRGGLVGRNVREFTSPETFQLIREQTQKRLAGESSTYEVEIIRPDGEKRQLLATATPWTDKDGRIIGALAIFRDETERNLAEAEIRKLSQFRESIIDNANVWLDVLDEKANIVVWNKAAEAISGYSREEVTGHGKIWEWLYPDEEYRKEVTAKVRAIMDRGEIVEDFETTIRRKDGEPRVISWHSRNLLDEHGRPIGSIALGRDVTERKRMEAALRESEERYRRLFEEATDGIALADADTGILLDCNQALAALVGRSRTELIGQHQTILHPPAINGSAFSPTFKMHATNHEGQALETQVITATGEIREVEIKANLLHLGERRILQGIFHDVTERKRAEEALRRRANEMAALQATVLDITGRLDLPVLLQTIVERAARLLNAPAGGMYLCDSEKQEARCVVSYNTPHDYTGTILKYGEGAAGVVAQTGEPLIVDDYRTWSGRAVVYEEKRPFKAVLTVPMIWQGRVTGAIHVLDDSQSRRFTQADQELLTLFANHAAIAVENARLLEHQKHQAEELARYSTSLEQLVLERAEKLAESERRFRELSDLLPQIVFEIDEKGNVQYMNRAGYAATGLSEEEFSRGVNAFHFLIPKEHERVTRGIQRVMTGEMIGEREFTVLRRDGTSFPALVYTAPITREHKSVGLRGIAIDITQRKRAEEELRAARGRLEYLVSSNPAVIYAGKPLPDRSDFALTYLSERVVSVLGFEPREFVGHPRFWERHVHPDDLRPTLAEIPLLWKQGQYTFEYRFLHKDGTYRWIREEAKVVRDANGEPVEVNGYWIDVTELKRMEEALLKSQRLATIGETAAIVGHDLRNPLEAIAGATYLLRRQATAGTIDDRGRESLRIIEKSIEYSDKIINDLLEYSAEIRLQSSTTDPKSAMDAALSLARIPENVRIVNETQAEPRMVVDAEKMRRAFLNIIRNAVEAMPQGGTVTISSRRTNDMVEFRFEDTGAGMSRETLEKLWTPLFTTKARGMGFGLAITRRIVEAHGGTVAADSEPGRGSTFTVRLPIKAEVGR